MLGARATVAALVVLLVGAGCASLQPATEQDVLARMRAAERDVLARILPASVQVVLERGGARLRTASGVVIAARPGARGTDCFVLTAGHVFSRLPEGVEVHVLFDRHRRANTRLRGRLVTQRVTDEFDLALLQVQAEACRAAEPGAPPSLGDPVWTVGFPWGRGLRLTGGVVSQVPLDGDGGARLVVDAPVAYGTSGSGVYDARTGGLVGLVEGYGTARVPFGEGAAPPYVDVPLPGETYVTVLPAIRRFLRDVGYPQFLGTDR